MNDIRYHIRKLSRNVIVEHLEMAGYACYDHESTEDLEEALAQAVENDEVAIVDIV